MPRQCTPLDRPETHIPRICRLEAVDGFLDSDAAEPGVFHKFKFCEISHDILEENGARCHPVVGNRSAWFAVGTNSFREILMRLLLQGWRIRRFADLLGLLARIGFAYRGVGWSHCSQAYSNPDQAISCSFPY